MNFTLTQDNKEPTRAVLPQKTAKPDKGQEESRRQKSKTVSAGK